MLASCSGANEYSDEPLFKTSFDDIAGWVSESNLIYQNAHSGNYSLGANPTNEYSLMWKKPVKKISEKHLSLLRISAFAKNGDSENRSCIVVTIDSGKNNLFWKSMEFSEFDLNSKSFTRVEAFLGLPEITDTNAVISIYLWSKGNSSAFIDDLELEFSK